MTLAELAARFAALTPSERDTVLRMAYAPAETPSAWVLRIYKDYPICARFNGVNYDLANVPNVDSADDEFRRDRWTGDVEWVERLTTPV